MLDTVSDHLAREEVVELVERALSRGEGIGLGMVDCTVGVLGPEEGAFALERLFSRFLFVGYPGFLDLEAIDHISNAPLVNHLRFGTVGLEFVVGTGIVVQIDALAMLLLMRAFEAV